MRNRLTPIDVSAEGRPRHLSRDTGRKTMIRRASVALGLFSLLTLAACGGGSATTAPSTAASAPAGSSAGELPCAPSTAAGTVAVSIKDLAFNPAEIAAKVGDVVAFTNEDTVNHTATLDASDCGTEQLS